MPKRRRVSNLLALPLLSQLALGQPMYPYEMAQALRAHGKDESLKINWGSLYTVVRNMDKHGLIEAVGTIREGRQPERTTYRITEAGREELRDWLRELLGTPERQYPPFATALADCAVLSPDEVSDLLRQRLATLEADNASVEAALAGMVTDGLPRIFLIEGEYQLAMRKAEANWVRGLLTGIAEGTLTGAAEWRKYHETGELPDWFGEGSPPSA